MSRLARASVLSLCLVATGSVPARAQEKPAAADVVFLAAREPDRVEDGERPAPFLARELVRQAILIAARDEGGLLTRDATLREEAPQGSSTRTVALELFCAASAGKTSEVRYVLSRPAKPKPETLWEWKLEAPLDDPQTIAKLAEEAEPFSRGELKAVLERTAALKPVPKARPSAAVPGEAQKELWEFNELALLDAVRRVHAEIRARGESSELLAALAIGYANLGSLTSYYFSPAHKAFSARALLYAQRLVHQTKGSGWALWHRAYVRTLAGLHHLAELDVAAAKEWQAKSPKARRPPAWTAVIEAFSQGRLSQMVEQAKTRQEHRLALYLNLDGAAYSGIGSVTGKAAQAVAQECPDCFRGWDAMYFPGQLNRERFVTSRGFALLSRSLRIRLSKFEGLPESIAGGLKGARDFDAEIKFRADLIAQLTAETASAAEPGEPSLAALAQMIQEIEFVQIVRHLQLEAKGKGGSIDDTVARNQPLFEHHRDAAFIDTFGRKRAALSEAVNKLARTIDAGGLGYNEILAFQPLRREDEAQFAAWQAIASAHADPVFADEMLGLKAGAAGDPARKEVDGRYMEMLWKTSSKLPTAVAARIAHDWRHARPEAAAMEKEFADDFVVMTALTFAYLDHKHFQDAQRCARRRIELVPSWYTYGMLATVYKRQGDMVRWEETQKDTLSKGFDRPRILTQLTRYYMDRKDWKQAAVYADQAAANYSAPAMRTAARCHELLGEWNKSEALMQALAEHTGSSALEWMLWCVRTGHGDVPAADDCARKYFESVGGSASPSALTRIGAYYLMRKEREKALVVFGKAFDDGHETYTAMHAALIADALGKAAERDSYLKKIIEDAKKEKPTSIAGVYGRLAAWMQKALPPARVQDFDFQQVDRMLRPSKESRRPGEANLAYFVGAFLKNRGAADKAGEYFLRCARTQNYQFFNYVLACQALRDLKIPVPAASAPPKSQANEGEDASESPNNQTPGSRTVRRRR
jgi:tetratricopeptide (TPR) repeat protein